MRTILRMVTFAVQSMLRNFWLSFVTTSVLLLTLITINAVVTLNVLANASVRAIKDKVQVEVYFVPGTTEEVIKSVRGYLLGLPEVKNVTTISAVEALTSFREYHASDAEVLAALNEIEGNPFGDALRIQAHEPDDFDHILGAIDNPEFAPYIKDKSYTNYQTVIDRLTEFTRKVHIGGFILAAFFGLISILIVFNTIRVAIYVHRDEIGVMKLVGAKDWFVRGPFLLEAVLFALIATLIMAVLTAFCAWALEPHIRQFFSGVPVSISAFYFENALFLFLVQWASLALLGMATTAVAMRKFLKA